MNICPLLYIIFIYIIYIYVYVDVFLAARGTQRFIPLFMTFVTSFIYVLTQPFCCVVFSHCMFLRGSEKFYKLLSVLFYIMFCILYAMSFRLFVKCT